MSKQLQKSLGTLIDLRQRELDLRQSELAQKQLLCRRVESTVERLDQLAQSVGPSKGFASAGLALNAMAYKQSVLALAEQQRQELNRQRADVAQAQGAVFAVARKQEVLGQVLHKDVARMALAAERQAQKLQDDLASQVWSRGRA